MKHKWLELTWPQRVLLLLQGVLILLFLILSCTVGRQQVMWYDGEPLRYSAEGDVTSLSGKVDGQKAVFTVSPGPVVEYSLGDTLYGPYSIVSDPSAVPDQEDAPYIITSTENLVGIEVREDDDVLFRGFYLDSDSTFLLFDEAGDLVPFNEEWAASDVSLNMRSIVQIAVAPQIVQRGHFGMFLLGALFCALCAVSILYADALFRFNLQFRIRNPEDAEPSDWALFGRWVGWVVLTIAAFVFFIFGLNYH